MNPKTPTLPTPATPPPPPNPPMFGTTSGGTMQKKKAKQNQGFSGTMLGTGGDADTSSKTLLGQ